MTKGTTDLRNWHSRHRLRRHCTMDRTKHGLRAAGPLVALLLTALMAPSAWAQQDTAPPAHEAIHDPTRMFTPEQLEQLIMIRSATKFMEDNPAMIEPFANMAASLAQNQVNDANFQKMLERSPIAPFLQSQAQRGNFDNLMKAMRENDRLREHMQQVAGGLSDQQKEQLRRLAQNNNLDNILRQQGQNASGRNSGQQGRSPQPGGRGQNPFDPNAGLQPPTDQFGQGTNNPDGSRGMGQDAANSPRGANSRRTFGRDNRRQSTGNARNRTDPSLPEYDPSGRGTANRDPNAGLPDFPRNPNEPANNPGGDLANDPRYRFGNPEDRMAGDPNQDFPTAEEAVRRATSIRQRGQNGDPMARAGDPSRFPQRGDQAGQGENPGDEGFGQGTGDQQGQNGEMAATGQGRSGQFGSDQNGSGQRGSNRNGSGQRGSDTNGSGQPEGAGNGEQPGAQSSSEMLSMLRQNARPLPDRARRAERAGNWLQGISPALAQSQTLQNMMSDFGQGNFHRSGAGSGNGSGAPGAGDRFGDMAENLQTRLNSVQNWAEQTSQGIADTTESLRQMGDDAGNFLNNQLAALPSLPQIDISTPEIPLPEISIPKIDLASPSIPNLSLPQMGAQEATTAFVTVVGLVAGVFMVWILGRALFSRLGGRHRVLPAGSIERVADKLSTRERVRLFFERTAMSIVGHPAVTRHHRDLATQMAQAGGREAQSGSDAAHLADLYERARYSPPEDQLADKEASEAAELSDRLLNTARPQHWWQSS